MHLISLTLQKSGAISCAAFGNFSAPRQQEIAVSNGKVLELLRPDESGKLQVVSSVEVFGLIRSLLAFRLFGGDRDYLVIGSDSGRITIAEFDRATAAFSRVHLETFGKTGMRRITPGQYLAADPKGRAIMVAAVEKQKLVYVMNRTATEPLTISSPLEAHKSHVVVFDVVGCDVGLENPVFAALELDYADADGDSTGEAAASAEKQLVYYELDLGLNTVARKWSRATDRSANSLVPFPGGADGPGGVLVCAENWVLYEHSTLPSALRTPIPRRNDMPDERGLLLTASAVHRRKGGEYFVLLQSELGDLYKATLTVAGGDGAGGPGRVTDLTLQYFDTIPCARSLSITRTGLLFAAAEFGNHLLYQFVGLGEADAGAAFIAHAISLDEASAAGDAAVEITVPTFSPRALTNLAKLDELPSLSPLTDLKLVAGPSSLDGVGDGGGGQPQQLLALCGRGPRSTLRLLREGVGVTELAVSPMPGSPMSVFTVRGSHAGPPVDKYIVLSFVNATLALSVGDSVEEVTTKETGFADGVPTLGLTLLADDSMVQVHPGGVRHIKGGSGGGAAAAASSSSAKRIVEWRPPGKRSIVHAALNSRQVVLALSGGDLVYFELDNTGTLAEREKKSGLGAEVTAIALGPVPEGRLRFPFCALADSNNVVRVLSLAPDGALNQVSAQALRSSASSLAIVPMAQRAGGSAAAAAAASASASSSAAAAPVAELATPHLFIGLSSGIATRLRLDAATGLLTDPRSRYLGVRAVTLCPVTVGGLPGVLALSSRPWLYHTSGSRGIVASQLSYSTLESAAGFASPVVPEAVVAIAGNTLRIVNLDRVSDAFSAKVMPVRYTPRRAAVHPVTGRHAFIIESDHNALGAAERRAAAAAAAAAGEGGGAAASAAPPSPADGEDVVSIAVGLLAAATAAAAPSHSSSSPSTAPAAAPNGTAPSSSLNAAAALAALQQQQQQGEQEQEDMDMETDDMDVSDGVRASSSSSSSSMLTAADGAGGGGLGLAGPVSAASASSSSVATLSLHSSAAPGAGGRGGGAPCAPGAIPLSDADTPGEDIAASLSDAQAQGVDVRRIGPTLPPSPASWGSAVRVVDLGLFSGAEEPVIASLHHAATTHLFELPRGFAALSVAAVTFHDHESEVFVLVGVAADVSYHPLAHAGGAVHTYRFCEVDVPFDAEGKEVSLAALAAAAAGGGGSSGSAPSYVPRRLGRLQFLHATPVEGIPYSLAAFGGRVLVGVGRTLRLYDLGKRKLLRKCEARNFPSAIVSLAVSDADRVFVGDAAESVLVVKYKRAENSLGVFADDVMPRHTSCVCALDRDTIAGGDKFGNVFIARVSSDVADDLENPTGNRLLWDSAVMNGAPNKTLCVAQFFVGEAVTSISKAVLGGGQEFLLYTTISGGIGALLPLASKEDAEFFSHLELFLRGEESLSLIGRDHVSFRSYYAPVKGITDGDFCELFGTLPLAKQKQLAEDLDRTPHDVLKKLEDVRNRIC